MEEDPLIRIILSNPTPSSTGTVIYKSVIVKGRGITEWTLIRIDLLDCKGPNEANE